MAWVPSQALKLTACSAGFAAGLFRYASRLTRMAPPRIRLHLNAGVRLAVGQRATAEPIASVAAERGFESTVEQLAEVIARGASELSEDDLEAVAGG